MNKEQNITIENKKQREIDIIKLRNTKFRKMNTKGIIPSQYWNASPSGGIALDLWDNINLDWVLIRDRIETYFINLFDWKVNIEKEEQFIQLMEKELFKSGQVAIVKLPNGEFIPSAFSSKTEDWDYYGEPKKITLQTNNKLNGKVVQKKNFVVIYNNSTKNGTLMLSLERMRQTTRALIDVDNATLVSRPKLFTSMSADDNIINDIERTFRSDNFIINLPNTDLKTELGTNLNSMPDVSKQRIDIFNFQLSNMLKLLGLQTDTANKSERMSELEVARNDEFDNKLIEDMWMRRNSKVEELKKLGLNITLSELEEQKEEKQEPNGEMNKKVLNAVKGEVNKNE